jgi:amino acid adenylation domain-containing protein
VGLCLERSPELVVGLLGILKAGGAYMPLEAEYPPERLRHMLEESASALVLTQRSLLEQLKGQQVRQIALDDSPAIWLCPGNAPASVAQPDDLAYVIYTSGSTGKPKGVMNVHRALVNRLQWMQDVGRLSSQDRVLQKTPVSFDVSVWEFLWTLREGATLVLADPGRQRDPEYLARLIQEQSITVLHFVPSMLAAFVDHVKLKQSSVRLLASSGEALMSALAAGARSSFAGARVLNLYGPTEAAIDVSMCEAGDKTTVTGTVPIGVPIWNTQLYVLDERMEPVPLGVAGELYIGGVGLARGYLNRPALTAERFLPSPFAVGERLYRTGDRVRRLADGELEYLGRLDAQVKVRGHRIELGESRAVLLGGPGVSHAEVIVREDEPGDRRLVAYFVAREGAQEEEGVREHLRAYLPDYMVPAALVPLELLPLTRNGKLDVAALPIPQARPSPAEGFAEPQTDTHRTLAEIWCEVLRLERIGIHDNLFELGGHSLLIVRITGQIEQRMGRRVAIWTLFESPTIATLAERLDDPEGGHFADDGEAVVVAEVDEGVIPF